MSIRDDLRTYLLTKSGITGLVDQRVHPGFVPQGRELPCLCLLTVSDVPLHVMEGEAGLSVARVQVTCWAETALAAGQLENAVRNAIDGFPSTPPAAMGSSTVQHVMKLDTSDIPEDAAGNEQIKRHGVRADYEVAYVLANPTFT